MVDIPDPVAKMILHPDTHKVLTTVSPDGKPHAIVCASLALGGKDQIIVTEVYMHRTREYLENNPNVEFLIWQGKIGYSLKGTAITRITDGPLYDKMCVAMQKYNLKPVALWEFAIDEIWDESASKSAGQKVV